MWQRRMAHLNGGDEAVEDVALGRGGALVACVPAVAQQRADVRVELVHAPEEGKEGGRGQVLAPGAYGAQVCLRHHRQIQLREHLRWHWTATHARCRSEVVATVSA